MQTPTRKPHRRSWEELRLEQIAIWGDAAYNTRHALPTPPDPPTPRDAHLDLDLLEDAVIAEGMELSLSQPLPSQRGSFSMCHSRSAEVFRRSGSYAAVARSKDRNSRRLPDVVTVDSLDTPRVVLTKRSSISFTGREYWMDAVTRGRRGRRDDFEEDLFLQTRRDSAVMRERDENNFRKSNAKLPERVDDGTEGHRHLRRARASMTMLGRYNRTRSSQLPPRASTMLLADNSVKTHS